MNFYFDLFDPVPTPSQPTPNRPIITTSKRKPPPESLDVSSMPIFPPSIPLPFCIASNNPLPSLSTTIERTRSPLSTVPLNVLSSKPPNSKSKSKSTRKKAATTKSSSRKSTASKSSAVAASSSSHHSTPQPSTSQFPPQHQQGLPPQNSQSPSSFQQQQPAINFNPHLTSEGVYLAPDYLLNPAGPASSSETDFKCPNCDKVYKGKHARSIWRRHLQDKHGIPLAQQPRRTRWDNGKLISLRSLKFCLGVC